MKMHFIFRRYHAYEIHHLHATEARGRMPLERQPRRPRPIRFGRVLRIPGDEWLHLGRTIALVGSPVRKGGLTDRISGVDVL